MYDSVSSAGYQHGSRRVGTMSTLSETSSRMPYGLSPVAEKMGEKGESSDMSSNTTGGGGSVHHARGSGSYSGRDSTPTAAIAPRGRGEGSTEFDDEDAEAMLRAPSPGSVKRPLQPLLAQYSQSPVSLSSASAFGSRSGSFASPKERHSVRAEPQETTSARLDVRFDFFCFTCRGSEGQAGRQCTERGGDRKEGRGGAQALFLNHLRHD